MTLSYRAYRPIDRAIIGPAELQHHSRHLGWGYRVDSVADTPLLEGRFGVDLLSGGLKLRHAAIDVRHTMASQAEMTPGLKLILVMTGSADVRFGGRRLPLAPDRPSALLVNLREADGFERRAVAGTRERSLTLTLPPEWLESTAETADAMAALPHLAMRPWQPSSALLEMAQMLLGRHESASGFAAVLRREGLALSMAGEGLAQILPEREGRLLETRQQRRLWEFIESGEGDALTLSEISHQVGMSASTLQRHAQSRHGMTLQRYLRRRRLEAAGRALRQHGIGIDVAAEIAGYSDATNFATAFRRAFGITPRQARGE